MIVIVNSLEIGWNGITAEELAQQERIANLKEVPLGKRRDLRRDKPYGRLIPLYPVEPDKHLATRSARWLCRCTCWKRTLTVVLAQNLTIAKEPTTGCGCVHRVRASENLAALKLDPEFKARQAAGAGAHLSSYHRSHPEETRARARLNGLKVSHDPQVRARHQERVRQFRITRNLDPDTPISTTRTRIRHAISPLTMHILRERDDFTCALCKVRGKVRFAVHHAVPVEADWNLIADPRNLITLCSRCHFRKAHAGSWKKIDPVLQVRLLSLAQDRERESPTPAPIVEIARHRLEAVGRAVGRHQEECQCEQVGAR